jgi:hypothetical protein
MLTDIVLSALSAVAQQERLTIGPYDDWAEACQEGWEGTR